MIHPQRTATSARMPRMFPRYAPLALALGACFAPTPSSAPCESQENCNLHEGGQCLPSPLGPNACAYPNTACPNGLAWGELTPDLNEACVAAGGPDAGGPDAGPDGGSACPTGAPVTNGQAAELVLGQSTFTSAVPNMPPFSGSSMSMPRGVFADDAGVWVTDSGNARVLRWNAPPIVNAQVADVALGQASRDVSEPGVGQDRLARGVGGVVRVGNRLIVADGTNNRVLIWNNIPTVSGQPASLVLGQPDFTSRAQSSAANGMYGPSGIWSDGTRLIVADTYNNRVLVWNAFPTQNQQPADVVIGQTGFGVTQTVIPPTAASLRNPHGVHFDGTRLFVADMENNRVLAWSGVPTTNGTAASLVIGQGDFNTGNRHAGAPSTNALGMNGPLAITVDECGALYVCDLGNTRVMVYPTVPTSAATAATAVLGSPDLVTGPNASAPTTAQDLDTCGWIAATGGKLYVADTGHNRVLRFTLSR